MFPITNFQAFWHPGQNTFGITVKVQDGRTLQVSVDSPQEFVAILALLNGPNPALAPNGHVVSSR